MKTNGTSSENPQYIFCEKKRRERETIYQYTPYVDINFCAYTLPYST